MQIEKVTELVMPYLVEHGLTLYEVLWVKEYGYNVLRVSVDSANGIDVDTLALVNEYLSEKLDAYESEMPEYMLEVCSPGAEKTLRNKEEISNSIGKYIHVRLPEMIYEGELLSFDDDILVIKINVKGRMKNINVNYSDIKKIRLAVKL